MDAGGRFVVAWRGIGQNDWDGGVFGRRLAIHLFTESSDAGNSGYHYFAEVATEPSGSFIVVWESQGSSGSDSDSWSIQGQRFRVTIFSDSFESGEVCAWSGWVGITASCS